MLGSAIPRRWIFSLALVGLVSIFAASYAAVWSSPANADSQGTGTGTGNGTALNPNQVLDDVDILPTSSGLGAGAKTLMKMCHLVRGSQLDARIWGGVS